MESVGKMENGQPPGFRKPLFSNYEESKPLVVSTKHLRHYHTLTAAIYIYALGVYHISSFTLTGKQQAVLWL